MKLKSIALTQGTCELNNNIRCIETRQEFLNKMLVKVKQQHKMYWNTILCNGFLNKLVKQQHKMYWNIIYVGCLSVRTKLNNNIRCIETEFTKTGILIAKVLNNNIRCIETFVANRGIKNHRVKQQHKMYWNWLFKTVAWNSVELNNNIRCIETYCSICYQSRILVKQQHKMYWNETYGESKGNGSELNNNIRCIETYHLGSIESSYCLLNNNIRCIETFELLHYLTPSNKLNNNIRCIQTQK